MIQVDVFDQVEMRVGTILEVSDNKKSRNPAYVLKIDFGETIGIKKSSAQITTLYKPEALIGRQVICCVNLEPMHIGSVKSEVRILGTEIRTGRCSSAAVRSSAEMAIKCFDGCQFAGQYIHSKQRAAALQAPLL